MKTSRSSKLRLAGLLLASGIIGCGCASLSAKRQSPGKVPELTVSRTNHAPVIDGVLDDSSWRHAATISRLLPPIPETDATQRTPQSTTVRVLWDPRFLYVSFDCTSNNVLFSGTKKHDDNLFQEDAVEVFIDGFGDGRQYVEVQVNPAGVNFDAMHVVITRPETTHGLRYSQAFCDSGNWLTFPGWEMKGLRTAARRTRNGWSAELAIPAESIMKRKGSSVFFPTELRANFVRCDHPVSGPDSKRELTPQNWSPVLFGCPHISPARMGRLHLKPHRP